MSEQIATISYAKSLGNIKENSDIDNKLIIKNEIRKYNCRIVDNPTVEYQNNQCVKQIDLQKIDDLFATVLIPQITEENSLYMGNDQIGSLVLTATSQPTWIIQKSDPTTGIYFNTSPFISCRSKLYDGITSNAQLYNKGTVSFSANSDMFERLNYPSGEIALKLTNTITKGHSSLTEIQVKTTVNVYLPFVITFEGNTNGQDNTRMVDFIVTNRTQIHTRFDNNTKYVTYLRTGSDSGVSDTTTYSTFFDYATGENLGTLEFNIEMINGTAYQPQLYFRPTVGTGEWHRCNNGFATPNNNYKMQSQFNSTIGNEPYYTEQQLYCEIGQTLV